MATFLFDKIVFGPVKSRRLGVSLGINLLPNEVKLCNLNCIYCECGWSHKETDVKPYFHDRRKVYEKLSERLRQMKDDGEVLDVITFAGNGEPTMHPDFEGVIEDTVELRNHFFPKAKIAVLSNATMLHKESVVKALKKVDQNILKMDAAFDETIQLLNQPPKGFTVEKLMSQLKQFEGHFILQTLFVKGRYQGQLLNNSDTRHVDAWLEKIKELRPGKVMIYTIARDTPAPGLSKVSPERLHEIAEKVEALGIETQISE